jgi:hypothetical protein
MPVVCDALIIPRAPRMETPDEHTMGLPDIKQMHAEPNVGRKRLG